MFKETPSSGESEKTNLLPIVSQFKSLESLLNKITAKISENKETVSVSQFKSSESLLNKISNEISKIPKDKEILVVDIFKIVQEIKAFVDEFDRILISKGLKHKKRKISYFNIDEEINLIRKQIGK